ncbi:uncharacterized protein VP01_2697g2 [Puccinia sorghi]|uniref:Uncharacterized protein n=1 Tax=Puccinia sorghi TaxID=27349 RepID=A0A0L6V3Q9_9BASI|nr:uncharacterized protein VP01_2697g2 [Puccinia sorghi]
MAPVRSPFLLLLTNVYKLKCLSFYTHTCQRRKSNVQKAAKAKTNSLTDPERQFFLDFHEEWDDPGRLLDELLEVAGYQDTIEMLIWCAFWIRFPKDDTSGLTVEEKLAALTGSVTSVNKRNHGDEEIQWSTNSLTDPEREFFLTFHKEWDDPGRLLDELLEVAGLEKVQEYNRNLQNITQYSQLNPRKQGVISECWKKFAKGHTRLENMKEDFNLTDTDQDTIETLIRCAFWIRFPKDDASGLTVEEKLAALTGSVTSVNKRNHGDEEIQWSTDIVQAGFNAEYKRYDLIVAPTLELLRRSAGEWWCNKFKAPYTSIIGPTMTGKTRLLIELAKHIPVVKAMKDATWENQLTAWFEYSFPVKNPKVDFDAAVRKQMKTLQSRTTSKQHLQGAVLELKKIIRLRKTESGGPDEQLKVLLAIDEARNLLEPIDQKEAIPYFRVLRRVLSTIPAEAGFFSVFTDTTLRVATFSPALDRDPSLRNHGSGCELFAPIFKISSIDLPDCVHIRP